MPFFLEAAAAVARTRIISSSLGLATAAIAIALQTLYVVHPFFLLLLSSFTSRSSLVPLVACSSFFSSLLALHTNDVLLSSFVAMLVVVVGSGEELP